MNGLIDFDKATEFLEEGKIADYKNYIYTLYSKYSCGCFLRSQSMESLQRLMVAVESLEDDSSNYELNLVKGFVYNANREVEKAYEFLTVAIYLDNSQDIPFALRASLGAEVNSECIIDAERAVLLRPCARNFFRLAKSCEEDSDKILFYKNAIEYEPDFVCAYNNMANVHFENGDYQTSLELFKKCIEIKDDYWAYIGIGQTLLRLEEYSESLKYAKLGFRKDPDKDKYYFLLGYNSSMLDDHESAINYYKKFLAAFPENEIVKKYLDISKNLFLEQKVTKAEKAYSAGNYNQAVVLLEECIRVGRKLHGQALEVYYKSLIMKNNPHKKLGEKNKHFKQYEKIIESLKVKKSNNETLSEIENNVSKMYKYYNDDVVGFGKYKGEMVAHLIAYYPRYLLWCIINLHHFTVDIALLQGEKLKKQPEYLLALEIAIIKELILGKLHNMSDSEEEKYYDHTQEMEGDWGGLYGEEAEIGYWNTH